MTIVQPKRHDNLNALMRKAGYRPHRGGESFVRPVRGRGFPRFHIYAEERGHEWVLDLHLDQRKPSYEGSRMHAGEHEGPAVEREAERIKPVLGL